MVGIYGIIADENHLNPEIRRAAFLKMQQAVDPEDFTTMAISGKNFSLGLTLRAGGHNKDMAMTRRNEDGAIAVMGYGRFRGDEKLSWAQSLLDRIEFKTREQLGKALLEIQGCFAVVAVTPEEAIIFSDRLGTKLLYYYETPHLLVLGPDIPQLLATDLVPKRKDLEGCLQVIISKFFIGNRTLVEQLRRFPAGSLLRKPLSPSSISETQRYWTLPKNFGERRCADDHLLEELAGCMESAICEPAELENDFLVPLSGGLDSRAIACFLSRKYPIRCLTYGLGEELAYAKSVSRELGARQDIFTNQSLFSDYFRNYLFKLHSSQRSHSVLEQYFHAPLFRQYAQQNEQYKAIFDGIYLDTLLSATGYNLDIYDYSNFYNIYGPGNISILTKYLDRIDGNDIIKSIESSYNEITSQHNGNMLSLSQVFYLSGRLRRYVSEAGFSREDYYYVFRPGFDYDLMDFAFELPLRQRKGILYTAMLELLFPKIMRIKYKDSYGNRKKYFVEKMQAVYRSARFMARNKSIGVIKYYPYQYEAYFFGKRRLSDYTDLMLSDNHLDQFFSGEALERFVADSQKKQWMLYLFLKTLFIQSFYNKMEIV